MTRGEHEQSLVTSVKIKLRALCKLKLIQKLNLSNKRSDVALGNRIHREHENTIEHILIVLNRENINIQV